MLETVVISEVYNNHLVLKQIPNHSAKLASLGNGLSVHLQLK